MLLPSSFKCSLAFSVNSSGPINMSAESSYISISKQEVINSHALNLSLLKVQLETGMYFITVLPQLIIKSPGISPMNTTD